MERTKKMLVDYQVTKVVQRMGQATMDVPLSELYPDGSISLDWVRCNFPEDELDISDEDIADDRLGLGNEEASASPADEQGEQSPDEAMRSL